MSGRRRPSRVLKLVGELLPAALGDVVIAAYHFHWGHGRWPRLRSPQTFSEKVVHRMLFDRRSWPARCADKYAVRDYVAERLGPEALTKLYHMTQEPSDIPFAALPQRFVVKPTHGSSWVRLVTDAARLDRAELVAECRAWLGQSYYALYRERFYRSIVPRILVEEFLDDGTGETPADYKFFVFDGKVGLVQVNTGRFGAHRRTLFDRDGRRLAATLEDVPADPAARLPARAAELVAAAERLGKGVDFVRVDLYDIGGRTVFGELTMPPLAGITAFEPPSFDVELGRLWTMPRRLRD